MTEFKLKNRKRSYAYIFLIFKILSHLSITKNKCGGRSSKPNTFCFFIYFIFIFITSSILRSCQIK